MALRDKGEKTRKSKTAIKDVIKNELIASNKQKKNDRFNKKILLSGENGTAKTSLSLSLFTQNLADDEIIVYVDIDNSGQEIIHNFYEDLYQSGNILVYNPNAVMLNDKGVTVKDEETVVNNVTSSAEAIKELIEEEYNIRGVIVDGISFLLEFAESKMRLEKNLAVDQGANINVWKIRNKFFREFSSAFMNLDVPVIFVSHADFIPELVPDGQELASVKKRFIDECSMRITLEKRGSIENPNVTNYFALIQKNRSDIFSVGREVIFMSVNNKEDTIDDKYVDLYNLIFPSTDDAGNTK